MIPVRAYLYAGIALVGLLIAAWAYNAVWQRGYDTAHAEVTAILNEERAAVQAERDASERKARETEQAHREALNTIATQYEQDKANAQAAADRTIADLRSGTVRLRDEWAGCETAALVSGVADAAGQPDERARLREQGASDLVQLGAECDAQARGLQAVIRADRGIKP